MTARALLGSTGRLVEARRDALREVLRRHGVTNVEVFGSVARGDDRKGNDLDLLVDLPDIGLFELAGIQIELEAVLGVFVDLVSRNSVKDHVRARIQTDLTPL